MASVEGEAEARLRAVLERQPDQPQALGQISALLQAQGRFAAALEVAETALKTRPGSGEAWLVKGDALLNQGQVEAALHAYQRAGRDKGAAFAANLRLGISQGHLGRIVPAETAFAQALALQPGSPFPRYQRGLLRLKSGDYARGWDDYEARWEIEDFVRDSAGQTPRALVPSLTRSPTREALAGKRVMVLGDQGVGDQMMFASLLPDLIAVAASVVVVCEARLVGLFQASFPQAQFTDPARASIRQEDIDAVVSLGSLGAAFRRQATDFPGTAYLKPSAEAAARWAERLGPRQSKLRVALSWRGGVNQTRRSLRSIPLEDLEPILTLPGCEFVSLQYGQAADEIAHAEARFGVRIRRFPGEMLDDFEDIAAAVLATDVVLTVQTALAHVAGAVGRRCLTLVPNIAEWRYGRAGERMAWYGSLTLLRQDAAGAWGPVIERARAALAGANES